MKKAIVKCILQLAALFLAMFLLCACGAEVQSSSMRRPTVAAPSAMPYDDVPPYRLFCSLANLTSTVNADIARSVQDHCDAIDMALEMHNSFDDSAQQVAALEQFAASGGGAVLCQPVDFAPVKELFARMVNDGSTVVTFGRQAGSYDAGVAFSDYDYGVFFAKEAVAQWVNDIPNGKATVAILEYADTAFSPACVAAGYVAGLAEAAPNAAVNRYVVENSLPETLALIEEEGPADILLADDDALALAAMDLLLTPDASENSESDTPAPIISADLPVLGAVGGSAEAISAIRNQPTFRATLDLRGAAIGWQLVDLIISATTGGERTGQAVHPRVINSSNAAEYNK